MDNKETYGIRQFATDVVSDIDAVRMIIKTIGRAQRFMRTFSLVWSYISILLFTSYGIYHGATSGKWTFPAIIFGVCACVLVANTVLLCLGRGKGKSERARQKAMHVFRWITAVLKLAMTAVTVTGLVGMSADDSTALRTVISLLSVFWMGITLTVDVTVFLLQWFFDLLKSLVDERIDRVRALANNTVMPIVKGYRLVRAVASRIPRLRLLSRRSKRAAPVAEIVVDTLEDAKAPVTKD